MTIHRQDAYRRVDSFPLSSLESLESLSRQALVSLLNNKRILLRILCYCCREASLDFETPVSKSAATRSKTFERGGLQISYWTREHRFVFFRDFPRSFQGRVGDNRNRCASPSYLCKWTRETETFRLRESESREKRETSKEVWHVFSAKKSHQVS